MNKLDISSTCDDIHCCLIFGLDLFDNSIGFVLYLFVRDFHSIYDAPKVTLVISYWLINVYCLMLTNFQKIILI